MIDDQHIKEVERALKDRVNNVDGTDTQKIIECFNILLAGIEQNGLENKIDENQTSLFPTEVEIYTESQYRTIPTSALTNLLKKVMNSPQRIESQRKGQISVAEHYDIKRDGSQDTIITYKGKDGDFTVTVGRLKELFAKRVQNGAKIFNFVLQKLNEQHYQEKTTFQLHELVEAGIYADLDSAYDGLKTVLDKFMRWYVEGRVISYPKGKRMETANIKAALVSQRKVTYKLCHVSLPQLIRDSARYITILPKWAYSLRGGNAYILLDYLYYLARQNTDKISTRGTFTISLNSIRQQLGLPSPEEVKERHGRHYTQLISAPIEKAITEIEDVQRTSQANIDLQITIKYDPNYKGIHQFLDGYIEISLKGEPLSYMTKLAETKKQSKVKSEIKKRRLLRNRVQK